MGEALGFLVTGTFGVFAVRYAAPVVEALQRLNEAFSRRIGLGKQPDALYGFMTVMVAGFGYVCILIGVIGVIATL